MSERCTNALGVSQNGRRAHQHLPYALPRCDMLAICVSFPLLSGEFASETFSNNARGRAGAREAPPLSAQSSARTTHACREPLGARLGPPSRALGRRTNPNSRLS